MARDRHRRFVTPEGVDLRLELASADARAGAFVIDVALIVAVLVVVTLTLLALGIAGQSRTWQLAMAIVWLLGWFGLRNFWFALFEMGSRGATPGKRIMGLRVVAREGARLTGGAVLARNAMREIEVYLPLTFLAMQGSGAGALMALAGLCWSGVFLFMPLFNADRLRVGDIVAGTWVVRDVRARLGEDLAAPVRPRRRFGPEALALYGIYELQTLEAVLRADNPAALAQVAATIRAKAALPDDGDDAAFLADYYAALCAHLEHDVMLGLRRENKHAGRSAPSLTAPAATPPA